MKTDELQERLQVLNDTAQAIVANAEAEKRDLTSEEQTSLDRTLEDFDRVKGDLDRQLKLESQTGALREGQGRKTQPNQPAAPQLASEDDLPELPRPKPAGRPPQPRVPAELGSGRNHGGFRSLGEMAYFVRLACRQGAAYMDPRLERLATPTIYGNESSGADGGFAVPPDFRNAIMERVMGEESLVARTDQLTSSSNTLTIPKDETTPWQTTGGIQAYWEGEGQLKTQSKPALETETIRLNKVVALVPMTDELLEDAPAMDAYLRKKAPEKIGFKVNLAIIQGTGVGQPLGILGSGATISVAKEGSQTADTINFANIRKMWARLAGASRSRAVWLINQSIEEQLSMMSFEGTSSSVPVFLPAGGISGSPFSTLYGRPIIPTEALNPLGDKGDIILADLSQYLTVTKGGANPKTDISIHLWFDYDITAYRFVLRIGGRPWFGTTISPRSGTFTTAAFVTLDERA